MHALPPALAPMAAYRQFIVYMLVPDPQRAGKTNKFPVDFHTGRVVNAHDPQIWTDAQTAIGYAAHFNAQGGLHPFGVGFVFTDADPFWFLDIDGAWDGQAWSPLAQYLCQAFAGCAIEVSSSGRGLHIFGTGQVPPHGTKNGAAGLEFYHTARFVALTGLNAAGDASRDAGPLLPWLVQSFFAPDAAGAAHAADWTDGPCEGWRGPVDDDDLIRRALRSTSARAAFGNAASFADLWTGDINALAAAYPDNGGSAPYDQSQADSALAQHLAFWTGRDCERIQRLMMRSALVRDKWEREDYMRLTITKVCARQVDVLTDKEPEPVLGVPAAGPVQANVAEGSVKSGEATVVQGATYLSVAEQMGIFKGCVYVVDQHRALIPGGVMLKESQFKVVFGGYTMSMDNANERQTRDAWEAFTQSQAFRCARADTSAFLPNQPPGVVIQEAGYTAVNTYWPVDTPRQVGDLTPFLVHLRKVLPNERDQIILLSYMAAVVQHKGIKFQWAPLLQGCEGNGKTLFSRCVAFAVGGRYSYFPKAAQLASNFNDWMDAKIFIGVEDIHVPHERAEVIEALKPMITGDEQELEGKGKDKRKANVCANWMINTNLQAGYPITDNSRRIAPLFCAQQHAPDLVRDGMGGDYFERLYNWLKHAGGYAIVNELLHTYPIPDEFNPATKCQRAPVTSSTSTAVEASRGGLEQEIVEAIEQGLPGFRGGWISSRFLDQLLDGMGGRRVSRNKRKEMLESLGYEPHPELPNGRVDNPVLPDGARSKLYVKKGTEAATLRGNASEVAKAYQIAQGA